MDVSVLSASAASPREALDEIRAFSARCGGLIQTDVSGQLELVAQSISDAYASSSGRVETCRSTPSSRAAGKQEDVVVTTPDKKEMKKIAKKALKKLPGRCGTCDEIRDAALKIRNSADGKLFAECMASALKVLLKKESIRKTGDTRNGLPVYALVDSKS